MLSFAICNGFGYHYELYSAKRLGLKLIPACRIYNSSAVAKMDDRLVTIDMGRTLGMCPFGGAGSPSNTTWPGPKPTFTRGGMLLHSAVWPQ